MMAARRNSTKSGPSVVCGRVARRAVDGRAGASAAWTLVENCCSIYESRPLICRTQGLPLLLESEEGELEVDFCPLNFAEPGATDELDSENLVPLEDLNLALAMVNLQYCRKLGIADEQSGQRQRIADIILKSKV